MEIGIFMQFLALSLYTLFVFFCFCDGFGLHILRKLIWACVFLGLSTYIFKIKNAFDLAFILPIPTLFAISLCAYEKKIKKRKGS